VSAGSTGPVPRRRGGAAGWAPPRVLARVPLRGQLVSAILLLGALAMVLFGWVGTAHLRSTLTAALDTRLAATATSLTGPDRGPRAARAMGDLGVPSGNSTWYAVVDGAGRFVDGAGQVVSAAAPGLLGSAATTGQRPPALPAVTSAFAAAHPRPFTVVAAGSGVRWRVQLVTGTLPATAAPGTGIVALTQESVDGPVRSLERIDVALGAALLALLGLAAWLVVRVSLRPLVDVEHTAEAIAAGDLTRRVPVGSERTEVGRLAGALNAMLGQIESAFTARTRSEAAALAAADQMRRFAADASHELRTPLTSIRGFAELSRSGVIPAGPETDRAMARIEDESIRMTGLVEDLLLLARLDQRRPLENRPVDLLGIAADAVADAAVIAPDHPVTLVGPGVDPVGPGVDTAAATPTTADASTAADPSTSAGSPAVVLGDEPRLRQVVSNLVANALHHTPAGTRVAVRVATTDTTASLEVSDDGPGLSAPDAHRVFERFYRADASRTRAGGGGGSGLGLSIVAALVDAHGGQVDVRTAPGAGATFRVTLPLAPPVAARSAAGAAGAPDPQVDTMVAERTVSR